jgi:hypothetical protein
MFDAFRGRVSQITAAAPPWEKELKRSDAGWYLGRSRLLLRLLAGGLAQRPDRRRSHRRVAVSRPLVAPRHW